MLPHYGDVVGNGSSEFEARLEEMLCPDVVHAEDGSVWPVAGEKILTSCGGFTGANVSLADGAPKWAKGVYVNASGNIVLDVRPKGTCIIVR